MQSIGDKNMKGMKKIKEMKKAKEMLELKILWSENQYLHDMSIENDAKIFRSLDEFDSVLIYAAKSVPKIGYCKTKFVAHYKGGEYIGRFNLCHVSGRQGTSTGKISSAQHIKDYVTLLLSQGDRYLPTSADKKSAVIWLNFANQSLKLQ